jgi:hypothetical protein
VFFLGSNLARPQLEGCFSGEVLTSGIKS